MNDKPPYPMNEYTLEDVRYWMKRAETAEKTLDAVIRQRDQAEAREADADWLADEIEKNGLCHDPLWPQGTRALIVKALRAYVEQEERREKLSEEWGVTKESIR